MLTHFYPITSPHIATNNAITTNFRINNIDISNNFFGLGINSKIPVSRIINIPYNINGTSIGTLFELNLIKDISGGTINSDYNIFSPSSPSSHNGLLIQFYNSNNIYNISFNYNVDISFVMIGGGGGGGDAANSNAGGGGGAGQLITGYINYKTGNKLSILNGAGGLNNYVSSPTNPSGGPTYIYYKNSNDEILYDISANGGGYGGIGKISSPNVRGSSSGGSGSWSTGEPYAGISTSPGFGAIQINNIGPFSNLMTYSYTGGVGNRQANDTGGGGGGGGAGGETNWVSNEFPGVGGSCKTITYGNYNFYLGGGGGGGGRTGGLGGLGGGGGGGQGGGWSNGLVNGEWGASNTGSGGGGAGNNGGYGGRGGSGTVIFYIIPSGVS